MPDAPARLRIAAWAYYRKDDVFGVCDALARAERALVLAGASDEADRVTAAFDVLEGGLTRGALTRGALT